MTELPEDEEGDFGYDPKDKEEFLINRAALLDTGFRIIERVARGEPVISAHWHLDEASGRGGRPDSLHKIRHGNFGFPDLSDDVYTDYVVPEGTRYCTLYLRATDNSNSAPLFILLPVQPDGLPARSGPFFGRSPKGTLFRIDEYGQIEGAGLRPRFCATNLFAKRMVRGETVDFWTDRYAIFRSFQIISSDLAAQ